jgi:hypothetical protein
MGFNHIPNGLQMKDWLLKYQTLIKGEFTSKVPSKEADMNFWEDQLFYSFLY